MNHYIFSEDDIIRSFIDFIHQIGVQPAPYVDFFSDGKLHRFDLDGDARGSNNGAYILHSDGLPAGYIQDWKHNISSYWTFDKPISDEQKQFFNSDEYRHQVQEKKIQLERQMQILHDNAAEMARIQIENLPEADITHPYLRDKHILPYGVKINGDNLSIPLRNIQGRIRSLQWISPDSKKRFFPESSTSGVFWSIALDTLSEDSQNTILVGEGFATMAKVYELTGLPSVAAMNCGNLLPVVKDLHGKFPNSKIIIAADNDHISAQKNGINPGLDCADKCIREGYALDKVFPAFPQDYKGSDWDDFAILHGDIYAARVLLDAIHFATMPPNIKSISQRISLINAQSLIAKVFPPVKWAVDGFLPEGLSILAGGPKVGKSILALHLAVGVAIGGCVLGKINVQQGEVLYLALEDTQRRIQNRIFAGELAQNDSVDLSALDIITQIPRQNEGGADFIVYWIITHPHARLIIIDTLQMFRKLLSGKGSMYSEDYETISAIKKIADDHHIAILLNHHLKKGMEGDWLSEISGSQGIAGAADTIFSLKRERNSNLAILHRTGRDVEEKDFIMKLDGFGWILQSELDEFTMPEWKSQILAFLKDNASITPMQLAQVFGLDTKTAQKNLARLVKEGRIRKTGYGSYSLPEE